ncbi:ABC transporter permease [Fulvivirga lutea]|uniref:ABC transporter permease n=1 Tax=Fulvivirga lutea TaxID=2810512 RepID=A0A974WHJ7_9BACT|nr:ABC transporter permease [Fulvivirga lutea]QSE98014.1 ABC transporter permease [Fulvivirga lutea]
MKENELIDPPEWPFKLLRFFCKEELVEQVEGDMMETFDYRVETLGLSKAKWLLYRDVFSMLRPFAIKGINFKNSNNITMLINYFKLTIRGIKSNKVTSAISIFGLALAISCCIVLFLFAQIIINANDFIEDADQIHMVTSKAKNQSGDEFIWGKTPDFIGSDFEEQQDGPFMMTRYTKSSAVVRHGDIVIEEPIEYVSEDFLNIFSFELTDGDKSALEKPTQIVLSHKAATKFFGEGYPLNKELSLIINGENVPVTVGAVAAKFPNNTYFDFNILVNEKLNPTTESNAGSMTNATFFKFKNPSIKDQFESSQKNWVAMYNATDPKYKISGFSLIAFDEIKNTPYNIAGNVVGRENISTLYGIIFFGGLLLFIACFNYINIALVSATKRLKEIGMRKSLGATKSQLINQFLSENIFLCIFSALAGLIIAQIALIPIFNSFFPLDFTIDFTSLQLWIFLFVTALFTGLISGLYPAFYVSSFNANEIFKGSEKLGSNKNVIFKIFLGIQFGFTFLIIFSGIAFINNSHFQKELSWGYDNSNLMVIPTSNKSQFLAFKDKVSQYPEVKNIATAAGHVGNKASSIDIVVNDEKSPVLTYDVSANYIDLMELELIEGRNFDQNKASDFDNGLIVNESFIKKYMIANIENDPVITADKRYRILGVVEDFHYDNFYFPIDAAVFRLSSDTTNTMILAKIEGTADLAETRYKMSKDWVSLFPDYPFNGYLQSEIFDDYYRQMSIPTNILILFATISIILSSIGLYGLVSLALAKKMKEISIRKVMGATMKHITIITNKPYLIILSVSLILALPVSHMLVDGYLDQVNAFHVPIDLRVILPSILLITLAIFSTIGLNLLKVAKSRPAENLKER